jgi:hypothetical protein
MGVRLWLTSIGVTGPLASYLSGPLEWILGSFLDKGIIQIDIKLNSIKTEAEMKSYLEAAEKVQAVAIAKVYTEAEKDEIRRQYLDTIRNFASFGSVSNNDTERPNL